MLPIKNITVFGLVKFLIRKGVVKIYIFIVHTGCLIWIWDILKSYRNFVFSARHFPPSFLWWKNVYILIFGIKKKENVLAHFSNFQPNHGGGDPSKLLLLLFQISKYTYFSTIKMMGGNVWHQKQNYSSSSKCPRSI